jgi:hypothetical protein
MQPSIVFSNALNIFALDSNFAFAVLQSSLHEQWARYYGSTLETRNRYNPTDCFETFPWVNFVADLETVGTAYHEHRRQIMLSRQEGLTANYNRFHDRGEQSEDIAQLRALHMEMDQTVAFAYDWSDLDLGHGFHATKQGERYTISESARRKVLDRLLDLNHQRYDEEVKAGLQSKSSKQKSRRRKKVREENSNSDQQPDLLGISAVDS